MLKRIRDEVREAVTELLKVAALKPGDVLVVGCSSSEVLGEKIGTASSVEVAEALMDGMFPVLREAGVFLAAQCCEHLNRAIILEREAAVRRGLEIVNAVPRPKAGGSFATEAYARMTDPVAVETVKAQAGLDIGGTLIGMHLQAVAVPVRLSVRRIGNASILCARTRPKFVGGSRAEYDENLL